MQENERYSKYEIGDWTYGWPQVVEWDDNTALKIGKFCSIADGVVILLGGEHNTDWVTAYPFNQILDNAKHYTGHPTSKGDVVIGNDVWIGREVLILSGVTIGDGAVVGARSVVAKDIAPYSIAAGNPARHIRFRFDERTINELREIAWWDWSIEKIAENLPLLFSPQVREFIAKHNLQNE